MSRYTKGLKFVVVKEQNGKTLVWSTGNVWLPEDHPDTRPKTVSYQTGRQKSKEIIQRERSVSRVHVIEHEYFLKHGL